MATLKDKIKLSSDNLKIIAIVLMVIDHAAYSLLNTYLVKFFDQITPEEYTSLHNLYSVLRAFGRLAFPIFAFFLVEGFFRTRNVFKYAIRLAIMAVISEIPFNLGLYHQVLYTGHQNVLFTLLIGLLAMYLCSLLIKQPFSTPLLVFLCICVTSSAASIAQYANSDYRWKGILLIMALYFARVLGSSGLLLGAAVTSTFEKFAPASFLLLYFYNPERKPRLKYLFYFFYPVHLVILYAAASLLGL